jgi:type 1 glutamine amidotransferase
LLGAPAAVPKTPDGKPLALLLAGTKSHPPGQHEYNAGVLLLAECLAQGAPDLAVITYLNGAWPEAREIEAMDTIVFYCDNYLKHMLLKGDRLAQIGRETNRGAGFMVLHAAVDFPTDRGGPEALQWMGGFFEGHWSVNPMWTATYSHLPRHSVTNGVRPYSIYDEWYFHFRFNKTAGRLIPILVDVPPLSIADHPDGRGSGNPAARAEILARKPQVMAWAYERPDGGRGFAFGGGHFHKNWANPNQRKLVLNAILWTAKIEVPAAGVESTVTADDLRANLAPLPAAP